MATDTEDRDRSEQTNAEILRWQTGYRVGLALVAAVITVALRSADLVALSAVAELAVGADAADWLLGMATLVYILLVLGIRVLIQRRGRAGRTMSTLMVVADLIMVFWLVFLLSNPHDYDRGLLIALFSLQLTHVYFGRAPALLMLAAIATAFIVVSELAMRFGGDVVWREALTTLAIFLAGSLLVTRVQSNLHERLGHLVRVFGRAEDGDFALEYDVAADRHPDAVTVVGRAYNRLRTQLASIVQTDSLTGCFNRRGFEQQFRRELARAVRTQTDVALLAIDLDFFKQVNDAHGHLVGDRVLAEMGELLRANARTDDVVARVGGEEFMVLAPNTPVAGAQLLAERILDACRRRTFGAPTARVSMTLSIGVVSDSIPDDNVAEAMRARADEALYAAKRTGRNRQVLWSHDQTATRLGRIGETPITPSSSLR